VDSDKPAQRTGGLTVTPARTTELAAMIEPAAHAPPAPSKLRWLWLAMAILLAAPLGLLAARALVQSQKPPLPVLETLPSFTLTDQNGKPSGLTELRGKVWVADFIFTRCPSICPLLTAHMAEIQKRTGKLGGDFALVSISVDPTFDTPPVLTRYMAAYHADPARWRFLTGSTDAIEKVVTDGFKEVLARDHTQGPKDFLTIVHGGHFVLVDRQGQIRGYYDTNEPGAVDAVVQDAKRLIAE
jgi:protein SCO1